MSRSMILTNFRFYTRRYFNFLDIITHLVSNAIGRTFKTKSNH